MIVVRYVQDPASESDGVAHHVGPNTHCSTLCRGVANTCECGRPLGRDRVTEENQTSPKATDEDDDHDELEEKERIRLANLNRCG